MKNTMRRTSRKSTRHITTYVARSGLSGSPSRSALPRPVGFRRADTLTGPWDTFIGADVCVLVIRSKSRAAAVEFNSTCLSMMNLADTVRLQQTNKHQIWMFILVSSSHSISILID